MRRITVLALGTLGAVLLLLAISTEILSGTSTATTQKVRGGQQEEQLQQQPDAPIYRNDFAVEILIDGVPQEKYQAVGKVYVEALKGVEYALRVRNPLPVRVAVALSVDGLNTIDAKRTTATGASKWVIPPHGSITIGGWQMSGNRARRFYFTSELDSYAARLGRPANMGLISAVFFREQSPRTEIIRPPLSGPDYGARSGKERRMEQPSASSDGSAKSKSSGDSAAIVPDDDYAATGIGRSVNNNVYLVDLDLESRPAATIHVRYEYRPQLVRLGLLKARPQHQELNPLRRRELAKGFEDQTFCPEP